MRTAMPPRRPGTPVEALTPRQREVLELLARGKTNAQIGEKLGISLDGAKWHVSEIITRLGVDSREEAADWWRAQNGLRTRLARLAAGLPLPHLSGLKVAVAAGGVAVMGGVAVIAVLLHGGGSDTKTPPGAATPGPEATATPGTQGPPRVVACPPRVDQAGCDFAAQAEDWVRNRDIAALTGRGSAFGPSDQSGLGQTLDIIAAEAPGKPLRLVTIGCPAAAGSPPGVDCTKAIGLTFTTLADEELESAAGTRTGLVLGFDRQPAAGPRLMSITSLVDGEDRRLALTGGTTSPATLGCTNYTGLPVPTLENCMPTAFFPARVTREPAAATPTPSGPQLALCPAEVLQAVCDFAAQAEATAKADGIGALLPAGAQVPQFNPAGTPRLASIGCPADARQSQVSPGGRVPSCARQFYLAFTTITDRQLTGQPGGVMVLRFGVTAATGMAFEEAWLAEGPDIISALNGHETTGCGGAVPGLTAECIRFFAVETLAPGQAPIDPNAVERIGGVDVRPLRVGADTPLPRNLVLYYTITGYATDGGSPVIWRAFTDSSGTLVRGPIWTSEDNPIALGASLSTFAVDESGGELLGAACLRPGTCIATGLGGGPAPGSAPLEVFRSRDGGVTWQDEGRTVPVGTLFIGFTPKGLLMTSWDGEYQFRYYPSGEVAQPPEAGYYPHAAPGIGIVWEPDAPGTGVTYDAAGNVIYRHQFIPDGTDRTRESVTGRDEQGNLLVTWMYTPDRPSDPHKLTTYIAKVDPAGRVLEVQSWAETETLWRPRPLTADVAIGNILLSRTSSDPDRVFEFEAALFDFKADAVLPLRGLSAGFKDNQNPFLHAAVAGAKLQVTGAGDCLNVRESAATTARSLGCFRDRVLLGDRGETTTAGGITWRAVTTPDGQPGWASAEFLR